MNSVTSRAYARSATKIAALFGTASFVTMAGITAAQAQAAAAPVEEVLVTGSLIRGAAPVGVPVTALSDEDFKETGSLTVADLLKTVPGVTVQASNSVTNGGGSIEKGQQVQIHGLGTGSGTETLMMINGLRFPVQGHGNCLVDPSIIPQLAVDHIDVLADGASATYGSDAVAGVLNVILKHGFDGAITQGRFAVSPELGGANWQATQLYGTKWDSGDVTISYEFYNEKNVKGPGRDYYTIDFTPFGFNNAIPIGNSAPGVVSTGSPTPDTTLRDLGFSATNGDITCNNCYSVPKGSGWDFGTQAPGPTTSWTALLANKGEKNLRNPAADADIQPAQQRNAATITFDQDLTDDVQFFAEGFYNNRRAVQHYPPGYSPGRENILNALTVPTTNPYYPVGAPSGLRISYNLGPERDTRVLGVEIASRYDGGFTADLPFDWHGKLAYSMSEDQNFAHATGMVNTNMVRAALGNTVGSVAANGSTPGQAAFTKPANIPYLNVFCDSLVYECNSPATLAYIGAYRDYDEKWKIQETALNLDGPLFDLPGGQVKAAIGANNISNHFYFNEHSNFSTANTSVPIVNLDPEKYAVWAVFGQVNVPVIGEANAIPLVKALNLEVAYRYDRYNSFGGVTTPKFAATWEVGYGLSLRGTYGKSFRAPGFSEASAFAGVMVPPVNTLAGASNNSLSLNCPAVGGLSAGNTANAGSLNAYLNPTCGTSLAQVSPGGLDVTGGAGGAKAIRPVGFAVGPEKAKNWALGFNFRPTDFLSGLNIDLTMYHIKIDGLLSNNGGGQNPNDPLNKVCTDAGAGCVYIVRANPGLPITDPSNATFLSLLQSVGLGPRSQLDPGHLGDVQFIHDGAITNTGWRKVEGLDFTSRYDWDMGDWGAWNIGLDGNYQLKDESLPLIGGASTNVFESQNSGGRLRYRGRLGWADNGFSVTGFVNFVSHSAVATGGSNVPPSCYWAEGSGPGSCYPGSPYWGPYSVFPSYSPGVYLFDVSLGYQTGTKPANEYLQNVGFQLTVLNLLDRRPPFRFNTQTSGGSGRAFDTNFSPSQRYVSFAITKVW